MGHFRKNIISILLSENCNLACRYCYINELRRAKTEFRSISIDFAKRGVDDFLPAIALLFAFLERARRQLNLTKCEKFGHTRLAKQEMNYSVSYKQMVFSPRKYVIG